MDSVRSVSYTHLDVYKRQRLLTLAWRWGWVRWRCWLATCRLDARCGSIRLLRYGMSDGTAKTVPSMPSGIECSKSERPPFAKLAKSGARGKDKGVEP